MFERIVGFVQKREVLIAVAFTVFGALLPVLLDEVTSALRTPTAIFLLLSLLVIVSTAMIGIYGQRHEKDIEGIRDELSNINRRLGLTVDFVHDPPKVSTGKVYRAAREIVERAEKEILVLHNTRRVQIEDARRIETEEYQNERDNYIQALLEKFQQHKTKKFFYRRIFQLVEGNDAKITPDRIGERWFEHIKSCIEILDEYQDAGYVKKSPLFLEQTFAIVDRRYVIWGINGTDPEYGAPYLEGALLFDDPHQQFVQYLLSFFQRIDAHARIIQKVPEE